MYQWATAKLEKIENKVKKGWHKHQFFPIPHFPNEGGPVAPHACTSGPTGWYIYQASHAALHLGGQDRWQHGDWTQAKLYPWSAYFFPKRTFLIARFMGPTWGPSGADRTQVGPILAPWTILSGITSIHWSHSEIRFYARLLISGPTCVKFCRNWPQQEHVGMCNTS